MRVTFLPAGFFWDHPNLNQSIGVQMYFYFCKMRLPETGTIEVIVRTS